MSMIPPAAPPVDPRPLMELATGYWASMVPLTINELGVCDVLARLGSASAEQLAAELQLDPRPLGFLLDAGVHLGLLGRDGQGYVNTPLAATYLVRGAPTYLGGGLRYALDSYPAWGRLPAAVRTGEAQVPSHSYLGEDPERTRRFVYGMHHRGLAMARSLVDAVDFSDREHLLDVGGGSGVYSILLCQKHPGLRSTVLDLPGVVAVAKEIVEHEGLAARIDLRPGDYHEDKLGAGYDAALLNGMLHRETASFCRGLITRAHAALRPGGVIVLGDVMLDDAGHGPLFSCLFALNMVLTASGGGAHSTAAQSRWLEEAGFVEVDVRPLPPPSPHTLIVARKP